MKVVEDFPNIKNEFLELKDFIRKIENVEHDILRIIYNCKDIEIKYNSRKELIEKRIEIVNLCTEFTGKYKLFKNHKSLIYIEDEAEPKINNSDLICEKDKELIRNCIKDYQELLDLILEYIRNKDRSIIYDLINTTKKVVNKYEFVMQNIEEIQ